MGQIIIDNLDEAVIRRLRERAAMDEVSLEQTVRDILTDAMRPGRKELLAAVDQLRSETTRVSDVNSTDAIRDWRDADRLSR
jgi:plasmid stability protein